MKKGFTLVEFIAVVAVLIILLCVVMISAGNHKPTQDISPNTPEFCNEYADESIDFVPIGCYEYFGIKQK